MRQYLDLLDDILRHGKRKDDRTGVGTLSVFGRQLRFDLSDSFPLLTTKKLHLKSIIVELLWFLRGGTNVDFLREHGVAIWDEWADEGGDLGPIYGAQWTSWAHQRANRANENQLDFSFAQSKMDGIPKPVWKAPQKGQNQIAWVVQNLKRDPSSRRHIVSAWNILALGKMKLPPCHVLFQFYVLDGTLSCQLYQRSADVFLGVPFNIASYALLTMMMAQVTGLQVGEFIHTFGDTHLYLNHLPQAREQLQREPRKLPTMLINPQVRNIFGFHVGDFEIQKYNPHPHIRADIAV